MPPNARACLTVFLDLTALTLLRPASATTQTDSLVTAQVCVPKVQELNGESRLRCSCPPPARAPLASLPNLPIATRMPLRCEPPLLEPPWALSAGDVRVKVVAELTEATVLDYTAVVFTQVGRGKGNGGERGERRDEGTGSVQTARAGGGRHYGSTATVSHLPLSS